MIRIKNLLLQITFLALFVFNLNFFSISQQISIYGAGNYGNLFAFKSSDPHVNNDFEGGTGYSFGISLSDVQIKSQRKYLFSLGFESYGGDFYSGYSGLGGGYSKSGTYQKYVIDIEFYPWKIQPFNNFSFYPGFEINATVAKFLTGTYYQYQMGTTIPTIDLKDDQGLVGPLNAGINLNFLYELKFNRFTIKPGYKLSFFLLPELSLSSYSFSYRHSLILNVGYLLK
jgi:hypothetical protein